MIQIQKEKNVAVTARKAFLAVAVMVLTALPIFVLGALVSAVYRHPIAEEAIKGEAVYWLIGNWQGGILTLPIVFPAMFAFAIVFILTYWKHKKGNHEPTNVLFPMRVLMLNILIPVFLSACAFMSGFQAQESMESLMAAFRLTLCFAAVAAVFYYITKTTETTLIKTPSPPQSEKRFKGNKKSR